MKQPVFMDKTAFSGASSFDPRMLLKVILYAYLQNIHSGRKMGALLKRDVNFM